jgi:hypothetical protein
LEILNEEFKVNVTGGNTDFWELKHILYYNRELNIGAEMRMVLVLQNFFNSELSLHDILAWQDTNTTDFIVSRHSMPIFEDGTSLFHQIEDASVDETFALMEKPRCQYLNFTAHPKFHAE